MRTHDIPLYIKKLMNQKSKTMKIKVDCNKKKQDIQYPCLMINGDKDIILYAVAENLGGGYVGIALKHPSGRLDDVITDDWNNEFVPFEGKITLQNY